MLYGKLHFTKTLTVEEVTFCIQIFYAFATTTSTEYPWYKVPIDTAVHVIVIFVVITIMASRIEFTAKPVSFDSYLQLASLLATMTYIRHY